MNSFLIFIFSLCLSFIFCIILLKVLKPLLPVDTPNLRSSHKEPTYNGGGLAVILSFFSILYFSLLKENLSLEIFIFLFSVIPVSIISLLDDYKPVNPLFRLSIQLVSVLIFIYLIQPLPEIYLSEKITYMGFFSLFIFTFFLIWLINLFNFMDGINGISSLEVFSVSVSMIIFLNFFYEYTVLNIVLVSLAGCALGFLPFNFPRAYMFLGDIGACSLGMLLGCLVLISLKSFPTFFWIWLIFLGVYIVDSGYTLVMRIIRKEKFYVAHSSHGYQIAAKAWKSHTKVSMSVVLINFLWLLPMGLFAGVSFINPIFVLLVSYLPLFVLRYNLELLSNKQNSVK